VSRVDRRRSGYCGLERNQTRWGRNANCDRKRAALADIAATIYINRDGQEKQVEDSSDEFTPWRRPKESPGSAFCSQRRARRCHTNRPGPPRSARVSRPRRCQMFGRVFGGATAYPKARGVWRDDERAGVLVKDEPVLIHCYTTPKDIRGRRQLGTTGQFLSPLGSRSEPRRGRTGRRRRIFRHPSVEEV
jgi:hypothetical protein